MSLFDHPDDLRQHGGAADGRCPEGKGPRLVYGAANHLAAGRFSDGDRFAGDHRFIDIAVAIDHFAVHGDTLARPHLDDVAGDNVRNVHLLNPSVAAHACRFGLQADQAFDGFGRPSLGAGLQEAAEQNERDDDCRSFEVDVDRPRRKERRRECGDERIEIGCHGADGDQRVHVGGAAQQCGKALLIETDARNEQHKRGQSELDVPVPLHPDRSHDQIMHSRDRVRTHFENEDRQGQQSRQCDVALQSNRLGFFTGSGFPVVSAASINGLCAVTRPLDRLDEQRHIHIALDYCPLSCKVYCCRDHAGNSFQGALHGPNAGGTGHAVNGELGGSGRNGIAGLLDAADQRLTIHRSGSHDIGPFRGEIDGGAFDAGHGLERLFNAANT